MFELTEEQLMVRNMCREFAEKELREQAIEIDRTHRFPLETTRKLGELGIMGVVYPEKYNGAGMDYVSYAIAVEEISRVCASSGVIVSAHNSLCLSPIYYFGTEAQKEKYLPKLCTGQHIGAFGLTEPSAGSDSAGTKTTATKGGKGYIINGSKNFITNGAYADVHVTLAVTDKNAPKNKNTSFFIIEKGDPGFSVGKVEDKLGICASSTTEMIYEDCDIPEDRMLGAPGEGFKIAMHTLDGGRVGIAAQALGIAQAALEEAAKYANMREQFGAPIGRLQAIQWMIADMATEIEAARLLVYQAAALLDKNGANRRPVSKYSAMAKLYASECAHRCTHKCIQIHGGYGYVKDYIAERLYRDARITEIYEGTSEIQRLVIATSVLSEFAD
ncbi:MAG TPA: acyl-CoA dehydrogenase [Spirochaetota bacterium]|jgi:butyryl-CoA dehydrogenase|nr:acyl-CoA dehydrogenase [Spirochaetota bacterium]OQA95680.1 MAG: Acyl-CoA dehydrogenase [Spirochaetes bacterium ADurb.Bin218]HOK02619.1 acyl-CoA dehydrogenase [Spirochaetota bacterium]HOK92729.1 acyl-CoA dehydrogenase [Spirochaetota bacterium]HON15861.1 acyl-CoA dehydrogenase [Spirochaetota bacterium]